MPCCARFARAAPDHLSRVLAGIIDKAKELGLREFEDKHKQAINQARPHGAGCAATDASVV